MAAHGHHHPGGSALATSAQATLHCLTGFAIGEVAGLAIGVMELVMNLVDWRMGGARVPR